MFAALRHQTGLVGCSLCCRERCSTLSGRPGLTCSLWCTFDVFPRCSRYSGSQTENKVNAHSLFLSFSHFILFHIHFSSRKLNWCLANGRNVRSPSAANVSKNALPYTTSTAKTGFTVNAWTWTVPGFGRFNINVWRGFVARLIFASCWPTTTWLVHCIWRLSFATIKCSPPWAQWVTNLHFDIVTNVVSYTDNMGGGRCWDNGSPL